MTLADVIDASIAYERLQAEVRRIRAGVVSTLPSKVRFCDYAVSLLDRKVKTSEIRSPKVVEWWDTTLELHLFPTFGPIFIEQVQRSDIQHWKAAVGALIQKGDYSPTTANGWLRILRTILNAAAFEFDWARSPIDRIKPFDTSMHHTYTEEEPNALTATELHEFLRVMEEKFPQHHAMVALGFYTGLRPSSLRPLRRQGRSADMLWETGEVLVRRSHSARRDQILERTKTGKRQRIPLPEPIMDILRKHVAALPEGPMRDSELLFPAEDGAVRSRGVLVKPFAVVEKAIGLTKHVTPRAMRRTLQDLCREAAVPDVVTRAISGHATESMQFHYSSVRGDEIRERIGNVVSLVSASGKPAAEPSGVHGGVHEPEMQKTGSG
jgi:integrase